MIGLFSSLRQFNWVDILALILLIRIGYISLKSGFSIELFKILGTLFASYLALHYYSYLADSMSPHMKRVPVEFFDFLFVLTLVIFCYLVFVILRSIFYRFIKLEAVPDLDRWGGFILGMARGIIVMGLVAFILVASNFVYLKRSVKDSYSGSYFLKVSPAIYSGLWNGLTSKFMTNEKFNKDVLDIKKGA